MKVLVTGASGFIGSHLCPVLLGNGHNLRILLLPGEKVPAYIPEKVEICYGNLLQPESLKGICKDVELVYHLAARVAFYGKKKDFYGIIIDGTQNLLNEVKDELISNPERFIRFIYTSSFAALGLGRHFKGLDETATPQKCNVYYGDAKRIAETRVQNFAENPEIKDQFEYVIVRPSNVIGPGSVHVSGIIETYLANNFRYVDHGKHLSCVTYIDNMIDGFILVGSKPAAKNQI